MAWASPRNANGAISVPVLTPVTASNSGLASGCWAGTCCHPWRNPAPKAPQSPPPETIRISIRGGADRRPAVYRSYSAFVRSSNRPRIVRRAVTVCSSLAVRRASSSGWVAGGRVIAGLHPLTTSPARTVTATHRHRRWAAARAQVVSRSATSRGLMGYLRESGDVSLLPQYRAFSVNGKASVLLMKAIKIRTERIVREVLFPQPRREQMDVEGGMSINALEHIDEVDIGIHPL